jgi:hypothetical protein
MNKRKKLQTTRKKKIKGEEERKKGYHVDELFLPTFLGPLLL